MTNEKNVILVTGKPGVGKTTCLQRIVAGLPAADVAGFLSGEIRIDGRRQGFQLSLINSEGTGLLASPDVDSPVRFGTVLPDGRRRLGVSFDYLDSVVCPYLRTSTRNSRLLVLDEVGPMQASSQIFQKTIDDLLDSGRLILASVAETQDVPWITDLKQDPRAALIGISKSNRDTVTAALRLYVESRLVRGSKPS